MNFEAAAKIILTLVFMTGLTQMAPALPVPIVPPVGSYPKPHANVYLVYTGTAKTTRFSSTSGSVTEADTVYLVLDLASPNNYSVLVVGTGKNPWYHIGTRVLSANGTSVATYDQGVADTSDPTENFLASLTHTQTFTTFAGQVTEGQAVLKYTIEGMLNVKAHASSHTYPDIFEAYATGPLEGLTTSPQIIFPANIVVPLETAAATAVDPATVPYSVNFIRTPYANLIGSNQTDARVVPYFSSLTGTSSEFAFDATLLSDPVQGFQPLTRATTSGTISLSLNSTLSGIANVGGSYEVPTSGPIKLPLSIVIQPIPGPLTSSGSPTVYENFLYHIVLSLGLGGTGGYVPKDSGPVLDPAITVLDPAVK